MNRVLSSILFFLLLGQAGGLSASVLDNGKVRAVFRDRGSFAVEELSVGGRQLAEPGSMTRIWTITCLGPRGEMPSWRPNHALYEGAVPEQGAGVQSLVFTWKIRYDYSGRTYAVRMRVSLPDDGDRLFWNLEAEQPEGWFVTHTSFPRLTLRRPDAAKLITTSGWGLEQDLTEKPVHVEYPTVTGCMQFLLVHNADGAVYFGTEDPSGSLKNYDVDGDRALNICLEVPASEGWTEDGLFRLPFAANSGFDPAGWEHAVNHWYKPYSYTLPWGGEERKIVNRLSSLPEWLLRCDGWLRVKGIDEEFPQVMAAADYFGSSLSLHWYWWHHHPYDSHYPDYLPAKDGFGDRVAAARAKGLHVTPYINGRLWDPSSDSYLREGGADASVRHQDGTLHVEIYPTSGVINSVTCPYTQLWHDKLVGLVDSIQLLYGVDGVYLDQIGCTRQVPCWNPSHGHPRGGGAFWLQGYRRILGDIRRDVLRPGNILSTEENGECYSDLFDMMLMVNTRYTQGVSRIIPVFPMVYSDRIVTSAYRYFIEDVAREDASSLRLSFSKALLYGAQPGWVRAHVIMDPKFSAEAAFLRNLMALRSGIHDVVVGGSFVREFFPGGDNPVRNYKRFWEEPAVAAAEWTDRNGRTVWILVNRDSVPHRVSLPRTAGGGKVTVPGDGGKVIRK